MSLGRANVYALANVVPIGTALSATYLALWGWEGVFGGITTLTSHWTIPPVLLLGGIVLHELIHGLTWALLGRRPLRDIEYGIKWEYLTPYAHARVPLTAQAYRWGAVMPGIILGLVPAGWGIATGDGGPFLYGLLFTVAAGGDFLILWLLRAVPRHALVEDHPTQAGCFVLEADQDERRTGPAMGQATTSDP